MRSLEIKVVACDVVNTICFFTILAALWQLGYAAFHGKAIFVGMVVAMVTAILMLTKIKEEDSTVWVYALGVGAMLTAMEVQPVDELHLLILVVVAPYVGWRVSQQWRQRSCPFALIITLLAPAGLYAMAHMSFSILNVALMVHFATSLCPLYYIPKASDFRLVSSK